jgi:hypothetical protein
MHNVVYRLNPDRLISVVRNSQPLDGRPFEVSPFSFAETHGGGNLDDLITSWVGHNAW